MPLKLTIVLICCLFLMGSVYALSKDLDKASIKVERVEYNKRISANVRKIPGQKQRIILLKNPADGRIVAVIDRKYDGKIVLNPRYNIRLKKFNYGLIPVLSEFSMSTADSLWANKFCKENGKNRKTYGLSSGKSDAANFWIETVFQSEQLKKYRISSKYIKDSDWKKVK